MPPLVAGVERESGAGEGTETEHRPGLTLAGPWWRLQPVRLLTSRSLLTHWLGFAGP